MAGNHGLRSCLASVYYLWGAWGCSIICSIMRCWTRCQKDNSYLLICHKYQNGLQACVIELCSCLASPLTCIHSFFFYYQLNWCWWSLSRHWSFAPFVLTVYFHVWARRFAAGGLFIRLQYENELQVRSLGTDRKPLSQSRYRLDTSAHLVKQNLSAKGQRRFAFFVVTPGGRSEKRESFCGV